MYDISKFNIKVKLRSGLYTPSMHNPEIGSEYECEGILQDILITGGGYNDNNINNLIDSCANNFGGVLNCFTSMTVLWDTWKSNAYGKNDLILSNFNKLKYKSIW